MAAVVIGFQCDRGTAFSYTKYTSKEIKVKTLIVLIKTMDTNYFSKKRKVSAVFKL